MDNSDTQKPKQNPKGTLKEFLVFLIIVFVVISLGVKIYSYFETKSECGLLVRYVPATSSNSEWVKNEEAHFDYLGRSFESRDMAVEYCIKSKSE